MRNINFLEFSRIIDNLKSLLLKAQLQEIENFENSLLLTFYLHRTYYLLVDIGTRPIILIFENNRPPLKKSPKKNPVTLFLNSHFRNKSLVQVVYQDDWGRKAELHFSGDNKTVMEIQLIPNQSNIILYSQEKQISWNKPKVVSTIASSVPSSVEHGFDEFRSPDVLKEEWIAEFQKGTMRKDHSQDWESKKQKDILKKQRALEQMISSSRNDQGHLLYEIGEYLKYHEMDSLPLEWSQWVQKDKSLHWNRENLFNKAKTIENKKKGTLERIDKIKKEIEDLENLTYEEFLGKQRKSVSLTVQGVKARKFQVSEEVVVFCGKNAKENMLLLKQAHSWDLWFHLKDYPSSFAILKKNKNYSLKQKEIEHAADWFIRESLGTKKDIKMLKLEIIYTECRFVRPIKGDKLGRVHYSHEKSLVWKTDP